MLFGMLSKKLAMPAPGEALAGRAEPIATAATHFVNGHPLKGPYPQGMRQALFGLGCFWGAERIFWKTPGVYVTAVGYAGGVDAEPDLPGGLFGAHRPHRGRARRLRPEADFLRGASAPVLGIARPDAGHAPG